MLKDFFGNELQVGDYVICQNWDMTYNCMIIAEICELLANGIEVKRVKNIGSQFDTGDRTVWPIDSHVVVKLTDRDKLRMKFK